MNKYLIGIIAVAVLGLGFLFLQQSFGGNVSLDNAVPQERFQRYDFFANSAYPTTIATTTSATSTNITAYFATTTTNRKDNGYFVVAGAKKVTLFFQRESSVEGNAGISTFFLQGTYKSNPSTDADWVYYNRLIDNVTNANTQTLTRVGLSALSAATTTKMYSLDPTDSFYAIRCIIVETTDGSHICTGLAEW